MQRIHTQHTLLESTCTSLAIISKRAVISVLYTSACTERSLATRLVSARRLFHTCRGLFRSSLVACNGSRKEGTGRGAEAMYTPARTLSEATTVFLSGRHNNVIRAEYWKVSEATTMHTGMDHWMRSHHRHINLPCCQQQWWRVQMQFTFLHPAIEAHIQSTHKQQTLGFSVWPISQTCQQVYPGNEHIRVPVLLASWRTLGSRPTGLVYLLSLDPDTPADHSAVALSLQKSEACMCTCTNTMPSNI